MAVTVRRAAAGDAAECGRIIYEAFAAIGDQHNFPRDFPSVEVATNRVAAMLIAHAGVYGVVAEEGDRILGSNFMDVRGAIAGIGPISVDPAAQNKGVGRQLMEAAIEHATARHHAGIRLLQAAYHNRSLSLYTRLGFVSREPISVIQGRLLGVSLAGYAVRAATAADIAACSALCFRVHGADRDGEVAEAVAKGEASVVERLGRITGYTTGIAFFSHTVAETDDDLKALIGAAPAFGGPGFLLPTRNYDLLRWCLDRGLRIVMPMTLMTIGLYNEPQGAYLPSILY